MLWYLVDGLAIVVALVVLVVGFPGRKARLWRRLFLERSLESQPQPQPSKASPRRDSSSVT